MATVSGNTITIVGLGTTTISASQWGNTTYTYAQDIRQNLVVAKASQTITFNTLPTKTYGDEQPFVLGPPQFLALQSRLFERSEHCLCFWINCNHIEGGTVNITASQAGDVNYNAAPDAIQSLTINKTQSIGLPFPMCIPMAMERFPEREH